MWRIKCGSLEVDLCQSLVARLFAEGLVPLKKARCTRERVTAEGREPFTLLSDVESVAPVRALHPTCDEHGERCP